MTTNLERNGVESEEVQNTFEVVEIACQEARRLGQTFAEILLKVRRLVEDQPSYNAQMDVWHSFFHEPERCLHPPDRAILNLEDLIDWKEA